MKSYMRNRPSQFAFMIVMAKLSSNVSGEIRAKMPQKPNCGSKKILLLGENGINSKLKHTKAHNSNLSGRFGDPDGRPGDWCHIQESPE